jgi:hypothetical protein
VSALKKPVPRYQGPHGNSPSPERKAVDDLTRKINGLLESDPRMLRKAVQVLEQWLRQKSK